MAAQTSTREGKQALIGEVRGRFEKMISVVFVDYKGLTVESATKLRNKFRDAGVEYKVVKNTLVKHAIKGMPYAETALSSLTGMTGVAWSYEDPAAAAKVVKNFRKDEGEAGQKLQVKSGILDGQVIDAKTVEEKLANLLSKDEMRAKLLATMQAPAQHFVYLLDAKAKKDGGES